jgi:hypothetical protein
VAYVADLAMLLVIGLGMPVAGRVGAQGGNRQNEHDGQQTDV